MLVFVKFKKNLQPSLQLGFELPYSITESKKACFDAIYATNPAL